MVRGAASGPGSAAFRHALDVAVAALEIGALSYAVTYRNTRRVLLPKFPYGLYYRILDETVLVVGCIHAKRHPRVWRSR
jgi:plasmid stabilization system protein ParE